MGKINLNTIEDLTRFQEELNNVINEHKMRKELETTLESVSSMPFYKLKTLFESISEKLFNTENGGQIIKKYVKFIKESKTLKNLFSLHETVLKTNNVTNPSLFLNEALMIVAPYCNSKTYIKEVNELGKIVSEGLKLINATTQNINDILDKDLKVSESIDYLYTNKKNLINLNEFVNHYDVVSSFINENKGEISENISDEISVENYMKTMNEMANTMEDEWKRKLIENICLTNLNGESNETLFNAYKESCLNLLSNSLNECEDVETRSTFENMKCNLERKKYIKENFSNDIVNLAELEETLK